MITDHGEFIEVIRPIKNTKTKTWEIMLDYDTKIPLYAGKGSWHLPHNGARFYGMILHEEPYKTREEMVMELIMSDLHIQKRENHMPPIFSRIWCMPSPETFTMSPIKKLLERYVGDGIGWFDPFAGANHNSPAEITNDLNPSAPTKYHLEALAFIETLVRHDHNGILFDPPYSLRQVKECYDNIGMSLPFDTTQDASFGKVKDIAAIKIRSGGYAICCGWNTNGFGKNRGFKLIEILLCPHGGAHFDTIITVEVNIFSRIA